MVSWLSKSLYRVWVACAGESAFMPHVYMHEIGHNWWLLHAYKNNIEYADDTAALGACCSVRCHNAPHMWQLGWTRSVKRLAVSSMQRGVYQQYDLPTLHSEQSAVMVIEMRGMQLADPATGGTTEGAQHGIANIENTCT